MREPLNITHKGHNITLTEHNTVVTIWVNDEYVTSLLTDEAYAVGLAIYDWFHA